MIFPITCIHSYSFGGNIKILQLLGMCLLVLFAFFKIVQKMIFGINLEVGMSFFYVEVVILRFKTS